MPHNLCYSPNVSKELFSAEGEAIHIRFLLDSNDKLYMLAHYYHFQDCQSSTNSENVSEFFKTDGPISDGSIWVNS